MFITINGKSINCLFIASFKMVDTEQSYDIVYTTTNGRILNESFENKDDRDLKYSDTVAALVASGMFIVVGDIPRNSMTFTSVKTEEVRNEETGKISYNVVYNNQVGESVTETFDTKLESEEKAVQVESNKINALVNLKTEIVEVLPETGESGIIYLVPKDGSSTDIYDEYLWIELDGSGRFEYLGTTAVDLSNYYNKSEIDAKFKLVTDEVEEIKRDIITANEIVDEINGE